MKVRGLSGRNEKLTNKRANRHMSTPSIILTRKMRESNGENKIEGIVKITISL